jgi:hypothetical protein
VCCLLPLIYTYEYVIYIMHMLLKIPYYFFILPYSGGFQVSDNQSSFRDPLGLVLGLNYHPNQCSGLFRVLFGSAKADPNPPRCHL